MDYTLEGISAFGLPPGPRYGRRTTGGAPPAAVHPLPTSCRRASLPVPHHALELVQRLRLCHLDVATLPTAKAVPPAAASAAVTPSVASTRFTLPP